MTCSRVTMAFAANSSAAHARCMCSGSLLGGFKESRRICERDKVVLIKCVVNHVHIRSESS